MAERKATLVEVQIHEKGRSKADRVNLDLAPALGRPLPEFAIEAWNADANEDIDAHQGRSFSFYLGHMVGDVAILPARVGPYGEPGDVVDTTRNELVLEHNGEIASRNLVRVCVFAISADRGMLLIEHARAGSLRTKVEARLRRLANASELGVTFTFTTLLRGRKWLETKAELEALTILRPETTGDLADGLQLEDAQFELKIAPKKRAGRWRRPWLALHRGEIAPKDFLRVVDEEEDFGGITIRDKDKVSVTVGDGSQSKTFELGDEKAPQLREVITTADPTGIPTDEELIEWGRDAAQQLAREDLAP